MTRRRSAGPWQPTCGPAATTSTSPRQASRPCSSPPVIIPTSCCSTSVCPTWTGSPSSTGFAAGRRSPSSCCRRGAPSATRSPRSTPGQTTTSPSPSGWTSSSPGCGPRCAGQPSRTRRRSSRPTTSRSTSAPELVRDADGEPVRLTPTEWQLLETLVRNRGQAGHPAPAARGRVGTRVQRPSRPPPSPPRPPPPEARARPVSSPLPPHRGRHGLPLPRLQLTGPNRAPRCPERHPRGRRVCGRPCPTARRTCTRSRVTRRAAHAAATRQPRRRPRTHRLDLARRFREDSVSAR